MPQFVIEREIPGASKMSEEELREASLASLAVLRQLGPEIRWLHSFVTDDKIYCIYYSPDETLIKEHAQKLGIPADRISAVRRILDPVNYGG
jgi:Nickel responsive protein SCO4226-like